MKKSKEKNVEIVQRISDQLKNDIDGRIWLSEQRFNKLINLSQINDLRQRKKAIIIGTAEHKNIGDAAITLAEQELLLKYFPEYFQVEFSTYEVNEETYRKICAITNQDDIVFIHGGGNLGDKYLDEENLRRKIIEDFPQNKIIIFPQTIYFSDTKNGQEELKKSQDIYNRHQNLTMYVRGKQSFDMATKYFPKVKIKIMPDTVMMLARQYNFDRLGILLSIRDDSESILSEQQHNEIIKIAKKYFDDFEYVTNMASEDIDRSSRAYIVYNELKRYAKKELVITDRLHGMIFSFITNTPCVVLPTYNQKLIDYYETFLKDSKYISFIKKYDQSEIEQAVKKARKTGFSQSTADFDQKIFSQIRDF